MSALAWPPRLSRRSVPAGTCRAVTAVALRRTHQRGLLTLALSIVCGGATFAWLTAWTGVTPAATWAESGFIKPGVLHSASAQAGAARESLVLRSDNRGQVLFGRYCDSCHTAGGGAYGPSLRSAQFKRSVTSPEKVADVVRKGGFDMPAFTPSLLSDADLKDIAAYVLSLPEAK